MFTLRSTAMALGALLALQANARGQTLRILGSNPANGQAAAVLVDDVPLLHTRQLLPPRPYGQIASPDSAPKQLERLLTRLDEILSDASSDRSRLVKLNFYLARGELREAVERALAERFTGRHRPAVSYVVTPLPGGEALVAMDAVAVADASPQREAVVLSRDAAVMPAGSRLYVSGQAEPGTLREATRKTLDSLRSTLEHCGRREADIVQLKCFLTPMASADEVLEEIASHFGPERKPPVSLVEWRSNLPIEIELIAWGGPAKSEAAEPLEFLTPPGMQSSPLYSRVARIRRGGTIFFSDLHGPADTTPAAELAGAYEALRKLTEQSGTDLLHLAKATYYVTDAEVSGAHNEIRPKYYDPHRPPAASKAVVAGTGHDGGRYVMDMIAVPTP